MKKIDSELTSIELAKKIAKITKNNTTGIVSFTLGSLVDVKTAKGQVIVDENIDYVLSSIEDETHMVKIFNTYKHD